MYDTLIIGAGMSGLAAGIRLAYFDQRVCIVERHTTIGGLNSFYRLDGRNYDVGLHAVTNYTPRGAKKGPLARLLRQLRMSWDELGLVPQLKSRVAFPHTTLDFSNSPELLEAEIAAKFPRQIDGFRRLKKDVIDYDDLTPDVEPSARAVVARYLDDPLLVDMLFCPILFYGSAREIDTDFGQFSILFRSIFEEGFARPFQGVRLILKNLVRRFRELGGELKLRAGVQKIRVSRQHASGLLLDDGTELEAKNVLSSAGYLETMRLCEDVSEVDDRNAGQLSFVETVSVLDRQPKDLGHEHTIVFYNDSPQFDWRRPAEMDVDTRCGVICSPNNFAYELPLADGVVRTTCLANFDRWHQKTPDEYRLAKLKWYDAVVASAVRFVPDFRKAVVATDTFTPTTIRRFTGHENGAVYGSPRKQLDGTTHLKNLFLCGTDQGWVGIIGSIFSGIAMANRHLLRAEPG